MVFTVYTHTAKYAIMNTGKFSALKGWQLALGTITIAVLGGLASGGASYKDREFYDKKLKQPPWSAPRWLFAPAWNINNFFLLVALKRLLNSDIPEKKKLLLQQGMIWLIFFSFGYVYFNKKSTVLAAVWTAADAALAINSFITAFKSDKKTAYSYLPLVVWTSFTSTIAGYQALKNPDEVLKTKALMN
jgi:benzodiazapine receptor